MSSQSVPNATPTPSPGFEIPVGPSPIRLGDPNAPRSGEVSGTPPGFDPVWGTLGAPAAHTEGDWLARDEVGLDGVAVDVEIFGAGFHISGRIHTGKFDRLSDWLNMQTGFLQVRGALHMHPGSSHPLAADGGARPLWVRLNQVVLVAERSPFVQNRPGAPAVQKLRQDVSIVTPGYDLRGNLHVHAYGSMTQFLESPDPHFLPITDLTVRRRNDAATIASFPFAMVNRDQLVTVLDETSTPADEVAEPAVG
jgi:hypothetical protein